MVAGRIENYVRLSWLLVPALLSTGCMLDVWEWDECLRDPELCSYSDQGWHIVNDCPSADPLEVQLGQGESAFAALVDGQPFQVYTASGGQLVSNHIFAALRVVNPIANHRKFRVQFTLSSPGLCQTPACEDMDYQRLAIIGANMTVASDGSASKPGFRLMSNGQPKRLEVSVVDECGRTAQAVHTVKPAQP